MNEAILNWQRDVTGKFQNSYKYALQLSLLGLVHKDEISYDEIWNLFIRRYWNNVIVYHLKETNNYNQIPDIHTAINVTAHELNLVDMDYKYAKRKVPNLHREVMYRLPKSINNLLQNPISRLQNDTSGTRLGGGSSIGQGWLYSWCSKSKTIKINTETKSILIANSTILETITIYHWALFIEKLNMVPSLNRKLSQKIQDRTIPKKLIEFIKNHSDNKCFYCDKKSSSMEIDHFIPFAFVYDHQLWNLVLSCQKCNRGIDGKFNRLPLINHLEKLKDRNDVLFRKFPEYFLDANDLLIRNFDRCRQAGFSDWYDV